MNIKTLYENSDSSFFQKIVEYNGHKFCFKIEPTSDRPCASIGHDSHHSLSIMLDNGTFSQIQDAKSLGAEYDHYTMYSIPFDRQKEQAKSIYRTFEDYIKKVY